MFLKKVFKKLNLIWCQQRRGTGSHNFCIYSYNTHISFLSFLTTCCNSEYHLEFCRKLTILFQISLQQTSRKEKGRILKCPSDDLKSCTNTTSEASSLKDVMHRRALRKALAFMSASTNITSPNLRRSLRSQYCVVMAQVTTYNLWAFRASLSNIRISRRANPRFRS